MPFGLQSGALKRYVLKPMPDTTVVNHRPVQSIEVALFTMGGTIDGADSDKGTLRHESDAAGWLNGQRNVQVSVLPICNKDSRQITPEDRDDLIKAIMSSSANLVLVTHGTFTICETGKAIKAALSDSGKTILLVGAWIPFSESNSDAPEQMRFAVSVLKDPRPGIWVAMDGELFDPDITEKKLVDGQYKLIRNRT